MNNSCRGLFFHDDKVIEIGFYLKDNSAKTEIWRIWKDTIVENSIMKPAYGYDIGFISENKDFKAFISQDGEVVRRYKREYGVFTYEVTAYGCNDKILLAMNYDCKPCSLPFEILKKYLYE